MRIGKYSWRTCIPKMNLDINYSLAPSSIGIVHNVYLKGSFAKQSL